MTALFCSPVYGYILYLGQLRYCSYWGQTYQLSATRWCLQQESEHCNSTFKYYKLCIPVALVIQ
jgi:hypothetical protein